MTRSSPRAFLPPNPANGPPDEPGGTLDNAAARQLLKALGDPLRLQVIEALAGGERCVCDLVTDLGLAQSKLSFHLKVLKQAGLLADRQEGRWIYYSLRPEALGALQAWLADLSAHCGTPASRCA